MIAAGIRDPLNTYRQVEAELARRSLREFIRQAWHVVEPARALIPAWHMDAIADHLQGLIMHFSSIEISSVRQYRLLFGPVASAFQISLALAGQSMDECPDAMTTTLLFNKTLEQARLLGARGGRAYARNRRVRKQSLSAPPLTKQVSVRPSETVAEAIARLDVAFAWLRGAERRHRLSADGTRAV